MSFVDKLRSFQTESRKAREEIQKLAHSSPFEQTISKIQRQIAQDHKFRVTILKNVSTFASLSPEALITAAQTMEEVFYVEGDVIIRQNDIGDSFFVVEEGIVSISRKMNIKDENEIPKELAQLGKNAHFGEISLLTAEPRSASVTVLSPAAKCLKMTKGKFDEFMSITNKIQAESRQLIGKDVLDSVPFFNSFNLSQKQYITERMIAVNYQPNTYICRQGAAGNTFYIITEGTCKVTINNQEKGEIKVATLRPGDFFGENALIEQSNRRNANVISNEALTCLSLTRTDCNRMLSHLNIKLFEEKLKMGVQIKKPVGNDDAKLSLLANKRRVCGFDVFGHKDEMRILSLFKRFAKFTSESLWDSLYGRLYRELLMDMSKKLNYGNNKILDDIIKLTGNRKEAVEEMRNQLLHIARVGIDNVKKSNAEINFIYGILKQRNAIKDKLCKGWNEYQLKSLCNKIKVIRLEKFKTIFEIGSSDTHAYLILRGSVRIYNQTLVETSKGEKIEVFYQEDLAAGDIFGEDALTGMHKRSITAQSISQVDLCLIDDNDFLMAQDKVSFFMNLEQRITFLSKVPLFKGLEKFQLNRLATNLLQEELTKDSVVVSHKSVSKDIHFIVNGRINIVKSLEKRDKVITSLVCYDYYGETGLINKHIQSKALMVSEDMFAVTASPVIILVLSDFHIFNSIAKELVEKFKQAFFDKVRWRRERYLVGKEERSCVRRYERKIKHIGSIVSVEKATKQLDKLSLQTKIHTKTDNDTNKNSANNDGKLLESIEDIPQLLSSSFNPFMVLGVTKSPKNLASLRNCIIRPKSSLQTRPNSIQTSPRTTTSPSKFITSMEMSDDFSDTFIPIKHSINLNEKKFPADLQSFINDSLIESQMQKNESESLHFINYLQPELDMIKYQKLMHDDVTIRPSLSGSLRIGSTSKSYSEYCKEF